MPAHRPSLLALVTLLVGLLVGPWAATDAAAGDGPFRGAEPEVEVSLGFSGIVRIGRPVHARLEIRNDGPDFAGEYRIEERLGDRTTVAWSLPLEIAAGARTVRWLTLSPSPRSASPLGGAWELVAGWAGSPREPRPLTHRLVRTGPDVFVVVTLTDLATGFSGVRQALDPQGAAEVQMPAVPAEQAPPDPAAWEAADLIVVDLGAAGKLDLPAWRALAVRVAEGASLLVHGAGRLPELMPEELRPGRVPEGAAPGTWRERNADFDHSAMPYVPSVGGRRVESLGEELPWAVTRRVGAGRVTAAGLNLRNLRSGLEWQEPLWAALLGLSGSAGAQQLRPPERTTDLLAGLAAAQRSFSVRGFAGVLALGGVLAAALFVLAWRLSKDPRLARLGPAACVAAALPLFAIGVVSRVAEDRRSFRIEEHFGALGRTRTTRLLEPSEDRVRIGRLELPGWPVRLRLPTPLPAAGTFRAGDPPLALDLRPAVSGGLVIEAESWTEGGAPFAVERDASGERLVRNLSGFELSEIHVLEGAGLRALGTLAPGEARSLAELGPPLPSAPSHAALAGWAGRFDGLGVAGVLSSGSRGLLARPCDGVVTAWLEEGS